MTLPARSRRWRGAGPLVGAAIAVTLVGVVLFGSGHMPVLGDYAEWTYHGVLFREVLRGDAVPGYLLKHYPVPNSLTTWGLGGLMLVLPWTAAAKLWLLVEVALGAVAALALRRAAVAGSDWFALVVLGGGFLGIGFWAGFSNFLFGCAFAMLLGCWLLRRRSGTWQVGVLLLLTFFSHMIPFGFALLLLLLYAQQERKWQMLLQGVPSGLIALWYFAGRALNGNADGQAGMVASVPYFTTPFLLFKANTFLKCWGFINPAIGPNDSILLSRLGVAGFMTLFLINLTLALLIADLLGTSAVRSFRGRGPDRFVWIAAGLFVAVGCLLPGALAGVSDPGGRMIQLAVWCGALLVGVRGRGRWLLGAGSVCGAVLLVANLYLLQTVAMRAPQAGELRGPLPAAIRQFGHVYYADRYGDYGAIESGAMNQEIYPTALFLKRGAQPGASQR